MNKFSNSGISFQDIRKQKPLKNLSDDILLIPKGTETQKFKIGEKVLMSGFSPIKPIGTTYTIQEVYKQNGYVYYILEEQTGHYSFRQKELIKA